MLNRFLRRWWPASLIVVALIVASWGEWSSAQRYNQNDHPEPPAKQEPIEISWPDAGGWTAIFTALLTVSTIGLWFVTRGSLALARDEFNATHRPKLFVNDVAVTDYGRRATLYPTTEPDKTEPGPARGIITVANGGDSVAFIIEWQAVVYYQASDAAFAPHLDTAEIQRPKPDAPGILPGTFEYLGHSQRHIIDREWEWFKTGAGHKMFFIGRVTYEGPDKIRRTTGFCRSYDKADQGRWQPTDYTEYEYGY